MSPNALLRPLGFVPWIVLAGVLSTAHAALIDRVQVVPDGSSDPPGYLITANVFRTAAESKAVVILRAFLVGGQRQDLVLPVPAKGQRNRDAKGNLVVRLELPDIKEAGWSEVRCVVPYADLQINSGTHRLGFDLSVLVDDKPILSAGSELMRVRIGDGARTSMQVPKRELSDAPPTEAARGFFDGDRKVTSPNEELALRRADVTERRPRERIRLEEVAVRIPGVFEKLSAEERVEGKDSTSPTTAPVNLPGAGLSDVGSPEQRTIFFATNRLPRAAPAATNMLAANKAAGEQASAAPSIPPQFSTDIDDRVHYGSCQVNIPVRFHRKGQIELPGWWVRADSGKVFFIASGQAIDSDAFSAALGPDDIVVFVHGFANTFDDAIFRAAQVAYDTGYAGRAVVFSWPSYGDLNRYFDDGKRADQSVSALVEVLRRVQAEGAKAGRRKIHIIAHSMGNRVLLKALYELRQAASSTDPPRPFGQIVLAAPDVSAGTFNHLVNYAINSCEQLTYYFCPQDLALKVSQEKNKYEPVGLYPYFQTGLVTIDAESANTSFLGHSYFAEAEPLLLDINLLFGQGLPPARRKPPLAGSETLFGHEYWVFGAR